MKHSFRLLTLLLCVTLCIVLLAGCEDKKDISGEATPSPSAQAEKVFMKSGDIYRYYVWNFATDTQALEGEGIRADNFRNRYNEMEGQYGIDIQFVVAEGNPWYNAPLAAAYAGSPMTDVLHAGGPFTLPIIYMYQNIPASTILPLDAYPEAATFSDSEYWDVKTQQASGMYNGNLFFCVPNEYGYGLCALNQVTFFNKDMVEEAGFEVADLYKWSKEGTWNWEKFEDVAIKTTNADHKGVLATDNNGIMFSLIAGNGGDFITKREVNGQMIDRFVGMEEKAVKAWDFFIKLSNEDNAVVQYTGVTAETEFTTGKAAMMLSYVNRAEAIYNVKPEDFNYGVIMPPKGPDATDYISDVNWFTPLCMMKNVANPEGCVQFMEEFFAPPYAKTSNENLELLKSELSVFLQDQESLQTCIDVIDKSSPKSYMIYIGLDPDYLMWGTANVNKMLNGETTPAAYFASIESAMNTIIDKAYIASGT